MVVLALYSPLGKGVKMSKFGQHVVVRNGKWAVIKSGASRATKIFSSQTEAVQRAQEIAAGDKSAVYVHDKSGLIRQRIVPVS